MKQILIRHTDDICTEDALLYAFKAWQCSGPDKTGIVIAPDKTAIIFSDRSKYPSMLVCKEEKK